MKRMYSLTFVVLLVLVLHGCKLGGLSSGASQDVASQDVDEERSLGVITSGLVGSWKFDSVNYISGGYWYPDGSGKGHDACFVPNWIFPKGWSEGAITTDSNYSSYVKDADVLDFGTGDFTIAVLIKPSSVDGLRSILDKRTSSGGYHLCVYNGQILLQIADSTGYTNYSSGTSPYALRAGQWYSVVATVDRDNAKGMNIYVDGYKFTTQDPTGRKKSVSNGSDLLIGKHKDYPSNAFCGDIDELRLYNRALSETEAKKITAPGRPAFEPAYWNMDMSVNITVEGQRGTTHPNQEAQELNNCYNYACNKRTDTFAQIGLHSGYNVNYNLDTYDWEQARLIPGGTLDERLAYCRDAAIADGLEFIGNDWTPGQAPPPGKAIVAMVFSDDKHQGSDDWHWYRLNKDNRTWSHKIASAEAINFDNYQDVFGNPPTHTIYDPRDCDRGSYEYFIGFFRVWSDSQQGQGHESIE
jgi:hypothetical protein